LQFENALQKSMFGEKDGTLFIELLLQECSSNITIDLAVSIITIYSMYTTFIMHSAYS